MIKTIADPYLAQNAGRRYPLADDTPYTDVPCDTAILDFRCTVRGVPAGHTPRAWLVRAKTLETPEGSAKQLTVEVRDDTSGETISTLVFELPGDMAAGHSHRIRARDRDGRSLGEMTVSAEAAGSCIPEREMSIPFAWTTVVCDSLKVDSLQSANSKGDARDKTDPAGRDVVAVLDGEVALAEGRNVEPYLDGAALRLDIRKGAGLGERCQTAAAGGGQTCDTVLFTVNGERPGSDGDLRIVGDGGVTVTPRPEENTVEIGLGSAALARLAAECRRTCAAG